MSSDPTGSKPVAIGIHQQSLSAPTAAPTSLLNSELHQPRLMTSGVRSRSSGRGRGRVRLARGANSRGARVSVGVVVRGGVSISRRGLIRGGVRRRGCGRPVLPPSGVVAQSGASSPSELLAERAGGMVRNKRGRPRLSSAVKFMRRKFAGSRIRASHSRAGLGRVRRLLMDEGVINMLRDIEQQRSSDSNGAGQLQRRSAASRAIERLHETGTRRPYRRRGAAVDAADSTISQSPDLADLPDSAGPSLYLDDSGSSNSGDNNRSIIDQEMSDITSDSSFSLHPHQYPGAVSATEQCVEHRVTTVRQSRIVSVSGHEHMHLSNGASDGASNSSGSYRNTPVMDDRSSPIKFIVSNGRSSLTPMQSATTHTAARSGPGAALERGAKPAIADPTSGGLPCSALAPAGGDSAVVCRQSRDITTLFSPAAIQSGGLLAASRDLPAAVVPAAIRGVSARGRGRGRPRLRRPLPPPLLPQPSSLPQLPQPQPPPLLANCIHNGYAIVSSATIAEKQTETLTVTSSLTSASTSLSTAAPLTMIQVKKMSRYVGSASPIVTPVQSASMGVSCATTCTNTTASANTASLGVAEPSVSWLNWTRHDKTVKKSVMHVGRAKTEFESGGVDATSGGGDRYDETLSARAATAGGLQPPLRPEQRQNRRRRRLDVKIIADDNLNLVQMKSPPLGQPLVNDRVSAPAISSTGIASDSAPTAGDIGDVSVLNGDAKCSSVDGGAMVVDFDGSLDGTPTSPGSHSFDLMQKRLELATAREAQRPAPGAAGGIPRVARFSLRCNQGSARLRELTVKKFSNFHQIVLCPVTTRLRAGLNIQVMRELRECLSVCAREPSCRAVLLTSSAGPFCQGIDYSCLMGLSLDKRKRVADQLLTEIRNFTLAVSEFEKPLVAGITGDCLGLGVALLPLCDLVFVSEKVTLRTLYHRLSTVPEGALTHTLPSLLGHARATALLMAGVCLTGSEAVSQGVATALLWSSTAHEELINRTRQLVDSIDHVQSVSSTKSLIRHSLRSRVRSSLEGECRLLLHQWCSDQFQTRVHQLYHTESVLLMQKPGFDTV